MTSSVSAAMRGLVVLASSWLPETPKSPARMNGSPLTKSPSDEMIGRFEWRSEPKKIARSAPSPTRGASARYALKFVNALSNVAV